MELVIGLFGTCGGSEWRKPYYEWAKNVGIEIFDPQIQPETHGRSWCEADIENELKHLENDPILVFKVTGETTGLTTFQEILARIQKGTQFMVILIEPLGINFKDHQSDPRLKSLREMLEEQCPGFKFSDPYKDAHRCRAWIQEFIEFGGKETPPMRSIGSPQGCPLWVGRNCRTLLH